MQRSVLCGLDHQSFAVLIAFAVRVLVHHFLLGFLGAVDCLVGGNNYSVVNFSRLKQPTYIE
jgi:hypothetical protein